MTDLSLVAQDSGLEGDCLSGLSCMFSRSNMRDNCFLLPDLLALARLQIVQIPAQYVKEYDARPAFRIASRLNLTHCALNSSKHKEALILTRVYRHTIYIILGKTSIFIG